MTKVTKFEKFIEFIIKYVLMLPVFVALTPLSAIYDLITLSRLCNPSSISPSKHSKKVKAIQDQVKVWIQAGRPNRMCTARPAWKTLSVHNINKGNYTQIKVDLEDIIEIDTINQVLTVEPGVMMGKLTSILIPLGWTIPVIPEFETLTIGGVICGAGIETSSFKYGLVADTCISYEVVLASGDVVNCSKDENSDLFYSIPLSHGTLGFLTSVKIPLIPATKYVKIEYLPCNSIQKVKDLLEATDHDFVEGIVYGPSKAVVMYGDMVNKAESGKVNHINRWYKPWFYKHAESFLTKSSTIKNDRIEYIPIRDYYHRHTRTYFWETEYTFPYIKFTLFRYLFGWILPINAQLLKLFGKVYVWEILCVRNHVLQDFVVPLSRLESSLEFSHQLVEVYPIWLCPSKHFNKPGMLQTSKLDVIEEAKGLGIDIGIYGNTKKIEEFDPERTTRAFEQFVLENHGAQALYADSYLTREEFRRMFNLSLYDSVRVKYDCNKAFPYVYDKVSRSAREIRVDEQLDNNCNRITNKRD